MSLFITDCHCNHCIDGAMYLCIVLYYTVNIYHHSVTKEYVVVLVVLVVVLIVICRVIGVAVFSYSVIQW